MYRTIRVAALVGVALLMPSMLAQPVRAAEPAVSAWTVAVVGVVDQALAGLDEVVMQVATEQVASYHRATVALTKAKGAQLFTDEKGVAHRETYYDLPMQVVMGACGAAGHYTVREDGAKVDKDGYVIVAANYGKYPRCSVVETSMGPGKVYDTGGFAKRHPHGFDLATDWTNGDGR